MKSAGEASMIGVRASQILRMIRLVRLIRFAKLYKSSMELVKKHGEDNVSHDENIIPYESSLGIKLFDLTNKRVIGLIILLLIIVPLFEINFFSAPHSKWSYDLETIEAFLGKPGFERIKQKYIDIHKDNSHALLYLE